jgi:nucleoside-diphosphate-sugar epimerase
MIKRIAVLGAGGFIGNHLVKNLKAQGHYVIAADRQLPKFSASDADVFDLVDLREYDSVSRVLSNDIDEVYQLAADMGGAGYVFTGDNDADIMRNSTQINLNICQAMVQHQVPRVFYASSACMYPEHNQTSVENPVLSESSAYPANPDSEYGWEKLYGERLYMSYSRNYGIQARIARLHNVYGPMGAFQGGREKAPAALCRKVAESTGTVDVWGPGIQTRSFLYIDQCVEGMQRIMSSDYDQPLNLGSERMISINDLVYLIADIAKKNVVINNTPGPLGVMGRTSDNTLIRSVLNWAPVDDLEHGIKQTYLWIAQQL